MKHLSYINLFSLDGDWRKGDTLGAADQKYELLLDECSNSIIAMRAVLFFFTYYFQVKVGEEK